MTNRVCVGMWSFGLRAPEPSVPIDIFGTLVFRHFYNPDRHVQARRRAVACHHSRPALSRRCVKAARRHSSEMANSELRVEPKLDGDESDRDKDEWVAGFDSTSSFVGLFLAEHSMAPEPGRRGMHRIHQECYLVCKAGAGLAGATFHARLTAALRRGLSLEECLEKAQVGPRSGGAASRFACRGRATALAS